MINVHVLSNKLDVLEAVDITHHLEKQNFIFKVLVSDQNNLVLVVVVPPSVPQVLSTGQVGAQGHCISIG
ncbi:hypothetical protein DITRI_Ditri07aG0153200 [Diplodiscus trichospermus]